MIDIYNIIDLNGSNLQSIGNTSTQWTIFLQMGTSNITLAPAKINYEGILTLYIDDGTIQESDNDEKVDGLGLLGIILLAIFLPLIVIAAISCCFFSSFVAICKCCFCFRREQPAAGLVYNTQQSSNQVPNPMLIGVQVQGTSSIPLAKAVIV